MQPQAAAGRAEGVAAEADHAVDPKDAQPKAVDPLRRIDHPATAPRLARDRRTRLVRAIRLVRTQAGRASSRRCRANASPGRAASVPRLGFVRPASSQKSRTATRQRHPTRISCQKSLRGDQCEVFRPIWRFAVAHGDFWDKARISRRGTADRLPPRLARLGPRLGSLGRGGDEVDGAGTAGLARLGAHQRCRDHAAHQ